MLIHIAIKSLIFGEKDGHFLIGGKTFTENIKEFKDDIAETKNSISEAWNNRGDAGFFGEGGFFSNLKKPKRSEEEINALREEYSAFTAMMAETGRSAQETAEDVGGVDQSILDYAGSCEDGIGNMEGFIQSLGGMTAGARASTIAMKALSSVANMGLGILIGMATSGIAEWLTEISQAAENTRKETNAAIQEEIQELEELIEKREESINSSEEEIESLENLQKQLDEHGTSKAGILSLEEEIQSTVGTTISVLDSAATSYNKVTQEIQAQINAERELLNVEKEHQKQERKKKIKKNVITNEGGYDVRYSDMLNWKQVQYASDESGHVYEKEILFQDWLEGFLKSNDIDDINNLTVEEADEVIRSALDAWRDHMKGDIEYQKYYVGDKEFLIDFDAMSDKVYMDNSWLEPIYEEWMKANAEERGVEGLSFDDWVAEYFHEVQHNSEKVTVDVDKGVYDSNGNKVDTTYLPDTNEIGEGLTTYVNDVLKHYEEYTKGGIFNEDTLNSLIEGLIVSGKYDFANEENLDKFEDFLASLKDENLRKELTQLFKAYGYAEEGQEKEEFYKQIEQYLINHFAKYDMNDLYDYLVPNYIEVYAKEYYDLDEEIVTTILDAASAIEQDVKPAMTQLGEAYQSIFTEDGFKPTLDNDMIAGLRDAFGTEFNDELNEFIGIISDPDVDSDKVQEAFNQLATSQLYYTDVLENANEETKNSMIQQLESMGIINAKALVLDAIRRKEEEKAAAEFYGINVTKKQIKVTKENIEELMNTATAAGIAKNEYAKLLIQEVAFNDNSLSVKDKVAALNEIAVAAGLATIKYSELEAVMNGEGEDKEAFAKANDIEVIKTAKQVYKRDANGNYVLDENGEKILVPNWKYKYNGVEYERLNEAYVAAQVDRLMAEVGKTVEIDYDGNSIGDDSDSSSTEKKFDWIETKIEYLSNKAEKFAKKATDSIFAYFSSKYKKLKLSGAIGYSQIAINSALEGKAYYEKERAKIGLSKEWADKVKYGAIDIDALKGTGNETLIKQIEDYQELTDKINNCDSTIEDLTSNIQEYAETLANLPIEEAEKKIDKYNAKVDVLSAKYDNLNSYTAMNKNLDKQYDYAKAETKAREKARKEAEDWLKSTWYNSGMEEALKTTANKGKKMGDELSTYGLEIGSAAYNGVLRYNEALKVSEEAQNEHALAVENETKLLHENTKAKYDNIAAHYEGFRSMTESKISQVDAYLTYRDAKGWSNVNDGEKDTLKNKLQLQNNKVYNLEQERKKYSRAKIEEQYKNEDIGFPEYTELISHIDDLDASILQAKTDALETQKVLNEFKLTSLGYQITEAQSKIDQFANDLALKEKKFGEKSLSKDNYSRQISDNNTLVGLYQKQNKELTILRDNTTKYSDLWFEYQEQIDANNSSINDLKLSNEDLKDSIRQIDTRPYVEMREEAEKAINTIDSLIGLIDDNSLFDDEGALTKLGSAKFSILSKELDEAKESVSSYQKQIEEVEKQYKNYLNGVDNGYSQAEYEADMEELTTGLLDAMSKSKTITDAIIAMHTQQQQLIIDSLKEEVEARNEALQKKKEYYDYDKQIRTKTKDIQALEAQKAALEVTEDSLEKRRKLVELEAELNKQREELEETQQDHEINLVVNGLNEFTNDVQERFDDYTKKLASSFEEQIKIIQNANEMYSTGYSSMANAFNGIMSFYGIDTSGINFKDITGYATGGVVGGTSYNGDKLIARVNSGESILTKDFTDLLPHAVNVMQDLVKVETPDYSRLVRVQPSINVSYDNMINIEGNATNETVVELKKLMPEITKKVTKSIKDDMKKSGY